MRLSLLSFLILTVLTPTLADAHELSCRGNTVKRSTPIQNVKDTSSVLIQHCSQYRQKNYNSGTNRFATEDNHFCDSVKLPQDIDITQYAHLIVHAGFVINSGSNSDLSDVRSDTITVGKIDSSGNGFMQPTGVESNLTAASAYTSFFMDVSPAMLNNAQASDGKIDLIVQDDTEVKSLRLQYCSNIDSKAQTEISPSCNCDKKLVSSKYGGNEICHYCPDNPIVISTKGTQNYDRYRIELVEFDLDNWLPVQTVYSSWECLPPSNCVIPPFLIVSDYLNGTTLQVGKTYMFSVSVGPKWSSAPTFFKIDNQCVLEGTAHNNIPNTSTSIGKKIKE